MSDPKTGFIGRAVERKEDYRFLTGAGQYTDDVALPGQTYGYFLRSPHAHARLVSVDTAVSVTVTLKNNQFVNFAPDAPAGPGGPSSGLLESEHIFSASVTDPDGDQVYYMWDWGNELSAWLGPYNSGETVNAPHTWAAFGTYSVKVKAKDPYDYESPWSSGTSIKVVARGDANSDGGTNVGDAVFLIGFVFKGGAAPDPALAGDANCDGFPNVGDAVYLIAYVFKGGPPPGCPE